MANFRHNVFARPKLSAQSKRNPFDLSHKRAFHASLGEIVPIFHMEAPAGSYVEINETNQTYNMNPLVRPAFSRIKEHIDYFAIPKVQLWSLYDNFITGQSQYMSSSLSSTFSGNLSDEQVPQQIPMFTGSFLSKMIANHFAHENPFGANDANGTCKLLDLLGYGNFYKFIRSAGDEEECENLLTEAGLGSLLPMNFWALLAYQKVYFSYFRNSQYQDNCVEAFNLDWVNKNDLTFSDEQYINNLYEVFTLRYRWLKKDYFMSVKPCVLPTSSEIGFTGLKDALQNGMNNTATSSNTVWQVFGLPGMGERNIYTANTGSTVPNQNSGQHVVETNWSTSTTSTTNVSALRFAFAYDKLLRRMREAGATFDDQMLAQFGIKPVDQRHGDAYWLGGFTNRLNINEVTQTGLGTDITALGQFGANISKFSANNETISYHAKEDCIILGVYSTSYDADYSSCRQERDNIRRYRFDYFNPAFEDLGCQPLYRGELTYDQLEANDGQFPIAVGENTKLLGYVKRYLEYKTKVDVVNGLMAFESGNEAMQAWTTQYKPFAFDAHDVGGKLLPIQPLNMATMLVNPCTMNSICTADYDGTWENDHFLVNLFNDVRMMANMSIDGENF